MNPVLDEWNRADALPALSTMMACCGARRWAAAMVAARPIENAVDLTRIANRAWIAMEETDWLEAFACHPRIGEKKAAQASERSAVWSRQEQSSVENTLAQVLKELAEDNARYEQQFGFTYIVCATGKTAEEMLEILRRRLAGDRNAELREAAEQQRQILQIRLGKWLSQ
jgi:2-oxo-4-hydroxy-4-carboxy-5-ureidoimidazoline decarboxylase